MKQRLVFGAIYIIVLLIFSLAHSWTFIFLHFVFMLLCIYELTKIMGISKTNVLALGVCLFALNLNEYFWWISISIWIISALLLYFFVNIPWHRKKQYQLGFSLYIIASFLMAITLTHRDGLFDPKYVLYTFGVISVNDSFAYLIGRWKGKTKVFPRISPKKTLEGFFGGVFFCMLVGFITYIATGQNHWLIISFIVSFTSNIGDLIESKLKRHYQIKDSGNILPGHGGIIDRLDSFLFSMPFIYLFVESCSQ